MSEYPLPLDRVRHWYGAVKEFEKRCRLAGKHRPASGISMQERDLAQAVECATVEALKGKPNLQVGRGNDGGIDGQVGSQTYDVKATIVRSSWDGPAGWNSLSAPDGRVSADIMVAALCTRSIDRAAIIGWARREARMRRIRGFSRPAYARSDLKPITDLVSGLIVRRQAKKRAWMCSSCGERYPMAKSEFCLFCQNARGAGIDETKSLLDRTA